MKFNTKAIHSHQPPDPETGAVITPIYQTTTFSQSAPGDHKGYDYSRSGNPTRTALEGALSDLEGGGAGFAFASGLGALTTLVGALLKSGDHIVVGDDVYGGTYRFLDKVMKKFGVESSFVDMTSPESLTRALKPSTRLVYLETPTNPLLKMADLAALIAIAKAKNITSCVDNTFATPYLQRPLELGADLVLHSTTKYIGGHSDVVGGALIVKKGDEALKKTIGFHQNAMGATPDPFASWLTLRGLKTLGLRMEAHCANALKLATFLSQHPKVESVIYPGLPSHPQHALVKKQMGGYGGGMISFRVRGGDKEARAFIKHLKYFCLAESLGGVESLVELPAVMTHASIEPPLRKSLGITDNLIRFSVGIEDISDLQEDVAEALEAV